MESMMQPGVAACLVLQLPQQNQRAIKVNKSQIQREAKATGFPEALKSIWT